MWNFRFIDDTQAPRSGTLQMAIDEVLLESLIEKEAILRIYRWSEPSVSFGYFGNGNEVQNDYSAYGHQGGWIRRWTGGGIVEHGDQIDLTYTLAVPREHPLAVDTAAASYQKIHHAILKTLQALFPKIYHTGSLVPLKEATPSPAQTACFQNPVAADIALEDKKVAGAAQRRTRNGLLHQGSIQSPPISQWDHHARGQFAAQLAEDLFQTQYTLSDLSPQELKLAEKKSEEKYATSAWLIKF